MATVTIRETEIENSVRDLLVKYLNPGKIVLFGSRAKGTSEYSSDFDLAVDAEQPDVKRFFELEEMINEVAGLHGVDIVYLGEIDREFRDIILGTGKIIYEK